MTTKKIHSIFSAKKDFWLKLGMVAFVFLLTLGLLLYHGIDFAYAGRVPWGLYLDNVEVGGMSIDELDSFFAKRSAEMNKEIEITYEGKSIGKYSLQQMGVSLNTEACRQEIVDYSRKSNYLFRQADRVKALAVGQKIKCQVWLDEFDFGNFLKDIKTKIDQPALNASVEKDNYQLSIKNSSDGRVLDEQLFINNIKDNFGNLRSNDIVLITLKQKPQINDLMAQKAKETAEKILSYEKISFNYKDYKIEVLREELFDWLIFDLRKNEVASLMKIYSSNQEKESLMVSFDLAKVSKFFDSSAYEFEKKPVNAKLAMSESGPKIIAEGSDGFMINRIKLIENMELSVISDFSKFELPVEETGSIVNKTNIDKLGIKELIGEGISDFSGSPVNRIHNIEVGAEKYNGTIIAPGEEFSFTQRLGIVDANAGFLPELVIADNETRPEYGGGLCQVSTTMFRVAIYSGLPITERHPHQYRVFYYEPAGMDSTIYIPSPDLKFVNDTKNYILIESEVSGTNLIFRFYGTKDGRNVQVDDPYIYNITSPPAPVYIYTDSLPAGEQWQVDSAHAGADAVFGRTITYADGSKKEEEFSSHYQAWPAKFKVGKGEVKKEDSAGAKPSDANNAKENDLSKSATS